MDSRKKGTWLAVLLVAAGLVWPLAPGAAAQEGVLVGRIAYTEGQVLRFVPETRDWVATVTDAPFGLHDALYSDAHARAELLMPNGLWVRIGASTQIQLIALKSDASEIDLASGVARFYTKSAHGVVKATTPFGYVLAEPNSTFDLYVGDQSVEVLALRGDVAFVHQATNARYTVLPGRTSLIANATEVAAGDGTVDTAWDDWNAGRDRLWAQRARGQGVSARHVPPQLQDEAYVLEEHGRWDRVYYEGEYHEFWRPTTVAATWQPFTVGRWTDWYDDQCWIPDEPFGYVTHHYGNWVVVNDLWYWAPPVATVAVATGPLLGLAWYPGRVAWIHSDVDIGWVPLAPTEVYYAHRAWGPRAVAVASVPTVSINLGSLAFAQAAVVVPQRAFYAAPTYTSVRVTNINQTTIVNTFRPAPVINQTVINNYNQVTDKYNFTNVPVTQKPHNEVVTRITHNQQLATQQAPVVTAATLKQRLTTLRPAEPLKQAVVPPPTVTNRIVPANQVNAPRNQVQFQPVEVKPQPKPAMASPAVQPAPGPRPGAPGAPQPGQPPAPGVPGVPPPAPGRLTPPSGPPTPPISPRLGTLGGQPPSGVPSIPPASPGAPRIQPPRPQSPGAPGPQPGHPPVPGVPPQAPEMVTPPSGPPSAPISPRLGTLGGQPPSGVPSIPPASPGAPRIQPPRPQPPGAPGPQPGHPPVSGTPPGAPGVLPQAPGTSALRPIQPTPPISPRLGTPSTLPGAPGIQSQRPGGQPPAIQSPPRLAQPPPAMQPPPRPAPQAPPAMQPPPRLAPQAPAQPQPAPRLAQPPSAMQPPPRPAPQAPAQPQLQPRPAQPPLATHPQPRPAPQPPLAMQPPPRPAPQAPAQPQLQPRLAQPPPAMHPQPRPAPQPPLAMQPPPRLVPQPPPQQQQPRPGQPPQQQKKKPGEQ